MLSNTVYEKFRLYNNHLLVIKCDSLYRYTTLQNSSMKVIMVIEIGT